MENNEIGLFEQIIKSVIDFKSYVICKKRNAGKAFLYLFLILMIFGTMDVIRFSFEISAVTDELHESFKTDFPDFKIRADGIEFHGKMPYIKDDSSDRSVFAR